MALSPQEQARYARHLDLSELGPVGQEKLRAARVLVVGAGGLGSPAALYLAAAGVGTVGILDNDRVELSNLQRQILYATADVGRPKVEAATERLAALNPEIRVVSHALELDAGNVLDVVGSYDIVLDGTDRLATRYVVNDACVLLGKTLSSAAIYRFEGQALTYVPNRGPCYRCLYADATRALVPTCATAGVLGVLPGVMGALQATEALKVITGIGQPLTGRLLIYDALRMSFAEFALARRADCAVCGEKPTITAPFDPPLLQEPEMNAPTLRRLSALEAQPLIGQPGYTLVDVREPYEYQVGHLPQALHIPLGELAARLTEIPPKSIPVFICRSGGRSLNACNFALSKGAPGAVNVEGGMRAWAAHIDPSIEVA